MAAALFARYRTSALPRRSLSALRSSSVVHMAPDFDTIDVSKQLQRKGFTSEQSEGKSHASVHKHFEHRYSKELDEKLADLKLSIITFNITAALSLGGLYVAYLHILSISS